MKKIALLAAAMALTSSAFAQGTMNGSNAGGFGTRPIYVGTVGGTAAGNTVRVEILAGPDAGNLAVVGSGLIAASGLFSLGTVAVPTVALGGTATVVVRAWDTSGGFNSFASAAVNGTSSAFTVVTGGNGSPAASPGVFSGMTSFAITPVPEPSTIALAGLGLGGLLLARRKKA